MIQIGPFGLFHAIEYTCAQMRLGADNSIYFLAVKSGHGINAITRRHDIPGGKQNRRALQALRGEYARAADSTNDICGFSHEPYEPVGMKNVDRIPGFKGFVAVDGYCNLVELPVYVAGIGGHDAAFFFINNTATGKNLAFGVFIKPQKSRPFHGFSG